MAALIGIAANLRAILAAQVSLQFVDRRRFRPRNDVQRHGLVGVAAEAADLEVEIPAVAPLRAAGFWKIESLSNEINR